MMEELCRLCREPALGYAKIGDHRYCHSDERSCYTMASRERWDMRSDTLRTVAHLWPDDGGLVTSASVRRWLLESADEIQPPDHA